MLDIKIKKASSKDAKILVEIYNNSFYEDFIRYGECPAYGRSVADMEKSIIDYPKHIAYYNSIPIGVISIYKKDDGIYYIGCLCVIPEYQGKGVGYQLVNFIKREYADWKKIELITPIDKEENIRFYTIKCGFIIDNEEVDKSVKVYHFSIYKYRCFLL